MSFEIIDIPDADLTFSRTWRESESMDWMERLKKEIEWELNQDHSYDTEINTGTKVFHKKFGKGKILKLDIDKAVVDFENFSEKKIYLKFLKIID